jgi:hypothetical protein
MRWIDAGVVRSLGNEHYRGLAFGWIFLVLHGVLNLGRGSIHVFKADGGASSIAGIDLSQNAEVILTLFAAMGLSQLLMGVVDLAVGLRYRALAPLLVGYHLVQQIASALVLWWWRPLPVDAPGKLGALAAIPVVAIAFYCATRCRESPAPATASRLPA